MLKPDWSLTDVGAQTVAGERRRRQTRLARFHHGVQDLEKSGRINCTVIPRHLRLTLANMAPIILVFAAA